LTASNRRSQGLPAAQGRRAGPDRFSREHWTKLRSINPLERVNEEIGRRTDVVGISPNDPAAIRLVGSLLIEQNDERIVARRYLSVESTDQILDSRQFEENTLEQQHEETSNSTPPEKRNAPDHEHGALHHIKRLD
jgi:hypothetical protein